MYIRILFEMFNIAKARVMNDSICQKVGQNPECKMNLEKKLVLPAI